MKSRTCVYSYIETTRFMTRASNQPLSYASPATTKNKKVEGIYITKHLPMHETALTVVVEIHAGSRISRHFSIVQSRIHKTTTYFIG